MDRRSFLRLGAAGALAVAGAPTFLSACGSDGTSRALERHRDGILRIGVAAAPSNINPLDSGSEVTRWIAEPVVETLYRYDEHLASVPLLADGEPEISGDGLLWTIRVRDGVTWHNGDPLLAADVVASLAHTLDLASGSEWITYMIGYVQSFRPLDDRTVEIRLARPYGLLRSHLTNLPIVHRDHVSRKDSMMGTGPYRLDGYEPGQSFTLSRYDGYHGEPGSFRGIEYTVFTDGTTRLVSLRQGKVDLITAVPAQSYDAARGADGVELVLADAPLDVLTYVNFTREPFSDRAFRQAVAWSMDRAGVLARVFGGEGTTGQGPIGPAELGWDPELAHFPARPDLERARSLLARTGTDRRSFTVTIGTSQTAKDIAQVLAAGWAEVDLDVTIEQLAGGPWSNKWLSLEYEMLMNTFQSGFTSGHANYLTLAPAHSRNVLTCGYHDDEVDAWIDEVWETTDDTARELALRSISRRLAEDAVIFPPVYARLAVAQRRELSALDPVQLRISRLSPQSLRFTDR
jgi:peptide/nickel transport system substrate-binding protein